MASKYGAGSICDILAKEAGPDRKTDAKLTALFGGGNSVAKVYQTVKVKNETFQSEAVVVFSKASNGRGATEKLKKKKKGEDVKVKNKDAVAVRKQLKRLQTETVVAPVPLRDLPGTTVKEKKKKNKPKKKKGKKVTAAAAAAAEVQDETISSSTTINESPSPNAKKAEGKKKKWKKEKLDGASNADKQQGTAKKDKSQKAKDSEQKKIKRKNKKLKGKKTEKIEQVNEEAVIKEEDDSAEEYDSGQVVKEEIEDAVVKEEDESAGENEEEQTAEDIKTDKSINKRGEEASTTEVKTIAERNTPKDKDPELEARTLYVGNIPGDTEKKVLNKMFGKFGKIETVRFRGGAPNKPTQLKKVAINKKELHADKNTITAYIRFKTKEEAEIAVNKGRGLTIKENHLVLDVADQGKNKDSKKAIFVGNLNLKLTDEELWRFFEECGSIVSVRIIRDNATGMGKGFGYVNFENKDGVEAALKKNQQELGKRSVRISRCVKKVKVKKGARKPGNRFHGDKGKGHHDKGRKWKQENSSIPGDSNEYSGDRLAEIGKLKRKSSKPNRSEVHKAKIAKLLTGTKPARTEFTQSKNRFIKR